MTCLSHLMSRLSIAAFAAILLAACTTLLNAPVYDAEIEAGLNAYHRDATAFIARTVALGPEGTFDSPPSQEFYSQSAGVLNNLVVRADAGDPQGSCAPNKLVASGLDALIASSRSATASLGDLADGDESGSLDEGSCLGISLKAVVVNHDVLRRLHKHRNALRPVPAQIAQRGIDQAVRLALIQVRSAKP